MEHKIYTIEFGGRELKLEFGKYSEQSAGNVFVTYGDTVVMCNATVSASARDGIDYFPLGVDFEEKLYAVGRIPGSWTRREGRPGEKAILTSRLIDRPLRPLFPKGMRNDVSIACTTLSIDHNNPPEVPAMIGASAALTVSEIPFAGPVGAVCIGMIDGEFIVNPSHEQEEVSRLHLVVAGTKDAVLMVEAGAQEVSEDEMLSAILFGHEEIKKIVALQDQIREEIGKTKAEFPIVGVGEDIEKAVAEYADELVKDTFRTFDRTERQVREDKAKALTHEKLDSQFEGREREIDDALYNMNKKVMRANIINDGVRPDGRSLTEVRPIWCEAGMLPRTHGSAVFTRGQTQVMTITTLGVLGDAQELDTIAPERVKRYMHHYNFPPYSTGEAKPLRSPGRREIGHGALAERALLPVIPSEEEFPYSIRTVSEVLSSNGSTSQASVCGSTLSLMDAGVPIKKPVAGVAMGLIKDVESGKIAVLTDIQGLEDFLGDMDFKVAGTKDGITAIQMDIKIKGIDEPILRQALAQAKDGRMHILSKMLEVLPTHREELSPYAPRIISFTIDPEKIREVIGSGGKTINKIIAETGVKIDIEDDGSVFIASTDGVAGEKAKAMIDAIVKEIEVGEEYQGKVVRILSNVGAFVELLPGKDGMIHISRIAEGRVEKIEDAVSIGDIIPVKVVEIDSQGRVNLDRTDIDLSGKPPRKSGDRPKRDGDRGGRPPRR
ncbi:MAG: polyribonucleotide nucleotidyltransferase [Clostridiales bacterium]|nr:polyribonucleotide nucleotidyltransferase [Clostridiales bacterium]MBQ2817634.1 polyribonucleotide nucleotidyltransferase [Clostridia bacterium]